MKESILYFMHVPWSWIKQRPHFLAECLSKYFDVQVCYLHNLLQPHKGVRNQSEIIRPHKLLVLPSKHINNVSIPLQIKKRGQKTKIIWLTHPGLFRFIKPSLRPDQVLIYDCMDDALQFPNETKNTALYQTILAAEKELCARADLIFVTSAHLRAKLTERFNISQPVHIINNGIGLYGCSEKSFEELSPRIRSAFSSARTKLTYVGTVAEWMDFNLIIKSLERYDNIEYLIFGPNEVQLPVHERIKFLGPVEHSDVLPIMRGSDILVMPFIVNELVLSVNPVKAYEYIYSGKAAVMVKYPETERFSDYVYLYDSAEKYCSIIGGIIQNGLKPKADYGQRNEFLESSTWDARARDIAEEMATVLAGCKATRLLR